MTDWAPEVMLPDVLITVDPPMDEAPPIAAEVMVGLDNVLLVNVSAAVSVTTTPLAGYVAVELTPVPPSPVGKIPVTAAACDKLSAVK